MKRKFRVLNLGMVQFVKTYTENEQGKCIISGYE